MKFKSVLSTTALLAGLAFSHVSSAALFDFAHYADTTIGESGYSTFIATEDGITLTASAQSPADAYAYLDRGDAGLGVCSSGLINGEGPQQNKWANNCVIASDDNASIGEVLRLYFPDTTTKLSNIYLKDGAHNEHNGTLYVSVDGGSEVLYDGSVLEGKTFDFYVKDAADKFYINALTANVPAPAPLALLAIGLLAAVSVKRKKA